jgi:hypothetical protein
MNKIFLVVLSLLVIIFSMILTGCNAPAGLSESSENQSKVPVTVGPLSKSASYDSYWGPYYDASGKVEIYYLLKSSYGQWNTATATVPEGFVCIGGGAFCEYGGNPGYLTGSWPSDDLQSWNAQSKDHCYYGYHRLTAVAVAMRLIDNTGSYYIPVSDIISHFKVITSTSEFNNVNPSASTYATYCVISGGAQVLNPFGNWGQLLTKNYPAYKSPYYNTWFSGSKAHVYQDAKQIIGYSVNYDGQSIPNFGYLKAKIISTGIVKTQPSSRGSLTLAPTPGWVMTGVGGATYPDYGVPVTEYSGRLLTQLGIYNFPSGINALVADTDFIYPDSTNLCLYVVEIAKY